MASSSADAFPNGAVAIECELQLLAKQIDETLTTAQQKEATTAKLIAASPSSSSSSDGFSHCSAVSVPNFAQIVQSIGNTMKVQNELCFKLLHIGRELVKSSEELAQRNDKLEKENGKMKAMKQSLDESQVLLRQKCQKLEQNLAECKEFLNRMAMEDDFRTNNNNNNRTIIVVEDKENVPEVVQKAADQTDGNNASDIIFVDDVIRNKWVAKIGQKSVKNEPTEVVELDDQPNEAELICSFFFHDLAISARPSCSLVNSPCTKRVKKEVN
ncbi:hypothetical protein niasHT_033491 [Heterodera trifolii]|uniref:Uncharacterized protein n=1 Tax=Heterodera trifolii TaxID=157864 RepID=A0ABD2J761_9BILA